MKKANEKPKNKYFYDLAQRTNRFIRMYGRRVVQITLISLLLTLIPSISKPEPAPPKEPQKKAFQSIDISTPPQIAYNFSSQYPENLTSEGVTVLDVNSGLTLYKKNSDVRFSPASTTKIMTALVAMDYFKADDILIVKTVDNSGSKMGLVRGEKLTFESLLYGILVQSANDAAVVVAENYEGGTENFVDAMNKKAEELHLVNTHFTNPVGYDDVNHYTTPSDLGRITIAALRNHDISKIVGIRAITVSDINYVYFHDLKNVNQLLGKIAGVAGVKTGYTENAAECLVTLVKRDDHEIVTIVLRSQDRFAETSQLISWVFSYHKWIPLEEYKKLIQANPR